MNGPCGWVMVALLVGVGLGQGALAPPDPRSGWVLDGTANLLRNGVPGQTLVGGLPLGFPTSRVRATLTGAAFVSPIGGPTVTVVTGLGEVLTMDFPGSVTDVVPDGAGGALVLVQRLVEWELVHWGGVGFAPVSLHREPGSASRVVRTTPFAAVVAHRFLGQSALVGFQFLNGTEFRRVPLLLHPLDLCLADAGLVAVGSDPGFVSVYDSDLNLVERWTTPFPAVRVAPFGDGVAVLGGSPLSVTRTGGSEDVDPVVLLGPLQAGALEEAPMGEVLLHQPASSLAYRLRPNQPAVTASWPGRYVGTDGFGLQDGRASPAADPDQDGSHNAEEWEFGTDPGSQVSAPLTLTRWAGRLVIRTSVPGAERYTMVATTSVWPGTDPLQPAPSPLWTVSGVPGLVFDAPTGLLNPAGEGATPGASWWAMVQPLVSGSDPFVTVAVQGRDGEVLRFLGARPLSQW